MSVRGRLCDGGQLAALVVLLLVLLTGPLAAQDALEQIAQAGAFVEDGAEDVDEEALTAALDEVRADGVQLYVGVLADDPVEGVESAADVVIDHAGEGTVLLLSPGEVGATSDDYDTATIDAGLDAAAEDFAEDGDVPEGVRAFGGALATADSGGGGLGGLTGDDGNNRGVLGGLGLPVILIGGLVALVLLAMMFGRGRRRRGHRGYGHGGYGGGYGRRRYRRRRGGLGTFAAGAATATAAGRMRNNRSTQPSRQGRSSSRSSGRSTASPSRGSTGRSRSRSSSSRSRSRSSRRR